MKNNKGKFAILIVGAVVCLAIGFVVGQVVQALGSMPGGPDDPIVSQSYVEQLVGEKTAAIQSQLDTLQNDIATLKTAAGITGGNTGGTTPSGDDDKEPNNPDGGSQVTNPTKGEITGSTVNIRKGASTSSDKIGSAVKGDVLTYVSTSGDWYQVKLADGSLGYVSASYAKLK